MEPGERRALIRWGVWFSLATTGLLGLVGSRYLIEYPWPDAPLARAYAVSAFLGHFALLGVAPWLVLVLPATAIVPSRRLVQGLGVVAAATAIAFVQTDSLVFAADRFHLSALALRVLGAKTWTFAAFYFAIALGLSSLVARLVWRHLSGPGHGRAMTALSAVLALAFVFAQTVHAWADARYYVPVTGFTPYLPLYRPFTGKKLIASWLGAVDLERERQATALEELSEIQQGILDYPRAPLRCAPPARPLNVLIIGLDSMRADALNPRVTPNFTEFAKSSLRFEEHWSGGNGTRPGLFSLFYGIPATYYQAFYSAQQPPVLIETFQRSGYEIAIYPSNPADRLVGLERTAFRSVANLPDTIGDVAATDGWLAWFANRDRERPFFSFIFYESAPGGCSPEYPRVSDVDPEVGGAAGRRACYETAVHFADMQVGRVLTALRDSGLLDETVVLVTSDHGEEFEDDDGQGFLGHGSGFSEWQLHTPAVLHWPGRAAGVVTRRTSHNDVAPTLLSGVLGCSNPPSDYSSGHSLFSDEGWPWIIASSYTSFAIVEPDEITISHGAYYEVRDKRYRLLDEPRFDSDVLSAAIRETSRFIKR